MTKKPINQWDESDRPREKMLNKGRESLSDAELLAILMGSGNRNESAVDLARRILSDTGNNLIELSRRSITQLTEYHGVGEAKAVSIVAALELGRRRRAAESMKRTKIGSSRDIFELMQRHLADLSYESFWLVLLSRNHSVIGEKQISDGGMAGTVVDAKRLFKVCIDLGANSVILCHNHPSGNIKPSQSDIELTKKIKEGGKLLDISVLDHLIFGEENYYSFADEGIM